MPSPAQAGIRWPALLAFVLCLLIASEIRAQALTVMPVSIQLAPGQRTATLTVINEGNRPTSFQVRGYTWRQSELGEVQLADSSDLVASPPLATVAPGARQTVRLVLRASPTGKEATYRILLDQIPGPAAPGTVQIALRLSIPIFAPPETRIAPNLTWRIENGGGQSWLVAVNDGNGHLTIRKMSLRSAGGGAVAADTTNTSPYILEGSTRRWRLMGQPPGGPLKLVGEADNGALDYTVR